MVVALGELSNTAVTVGLALLGLGWSASTVAGSALVGRGGLGACHCCGRACGVASYARHTIRTTRHRSGCERAGSGDDCCDYC